MKKILIIICIFLILTSCNQSEQLVFNRHIGKYQLDTKQTDLGYYYKPDSNIYKKLTVEFKSDSTFKFNFDVPFIYGNSGTWIAGDGDPYRSNYLFYSNSTISTQFWPPYIEFNDTFFLMNSVTPKRGEKSINELYFKKV